MLKTVQASRKLSLLLVLLTCLSLVMFPALDVQAATTAKKANLSKIIDLNAGANDDNSYLSQITDPSALKEAFNSNISDSDSSMQFHAGSLASDVTAQQSDPCSSLPANTGGGVIFPRCAAPGVVFRLLANMSAGEKVNVFLVNDENQEKETVGSATTLSNGIFSFSVSTRSVSENLFRRWHFSVEGSSSGKKVNLYAFTSLFGVGVFLYRLNHKGSINSISGLAVTGFIPNETLTVVIFDPGDKLTVLSVKANSSGGFTFAYFPTIISSTKGSWLQLVQSTANDLTISRVLQLN